MIVVVAKDKRVVKKRDQLRRRHHDRLVEQLKRIEIVSGRGKKSRIQLSSSREYMLGIVLHYHSSTNLDVDFSVKDTPKHA